MESERVGSHRRVCEEMGILDQRVPGDYDSYESMEGDEGGRSTGI